MKDWHNPKNFVVQLGALITLYVALTSLITLIFGIINIKFPDALDYYAAESAREMIRTSIAFVVVFFPAYIVLTRVSNQDRRQAEKGEYTTLAKWLIYLSFIVAGGVLLGDLVTILMYFLDGEITTRFILKALSLFIVVGIALYYYILDVRGEIKANEKKSMQFGAAAVILVLTALFVGFANIETPSQVREMRLDDQQVTDLQEIQYRAEEYYRVEGMLPATLEALYDGGKHPQAPEDRAGYQYTKLDETTYELCATFAHSSSDGQDTRSIVVPLGKDNYNWDHAAGEHCFKRVVMTPTEVMQ